MKTNNDKRTSETSEREETPEFWQRLKNRFWSSESDDTANELAIAEAVEENSNLSSSDAQAQAEREFALSPHIQELWHQIFPLIGVPPSKAGEFAGLFKVTPGMNKGEALIHIDVPSQAYVEGEPPTMERIVTLTVKMDHDYRLLGDEYYCIDCVPTQETRH